MKKDIKNNGKTLTLKKLKNYLNEWVDCEQIVELNGSYDSFERTLKLIEILTGEVYFLKKFKADEMISDDVEVSTRNITDLSLRSVIEDCIDFDYINSEIESSSPTQTQPE